MTDVLLLVPFEPGPAAMADAQFRVTAGGFMMSPIFVALQELQEYVGRELRFADESGPRFAGSSPQSPKHRSATAVALASHLERAGLAWKALDPGDVDIAWWRQRLERERADRPRVIALSTTFVLTFPWLRTFVSVLRAIFPESTLVVGGYYYTTNAKSFLSLDADVFCVGEGEVRLPEIVRAVRDRSPLDAIGGLFLRRADDSLHYTGAAEALHLGKLPHPDWRLASRIEPPVDLAHEPSVFGVETQRGCVFKCEFCTYRTLAELAIMPPDIAAEAILAPSEHPSDCRSTGSGSFIVLGDATATFPHDRWTEILEAMVRRGGSRHPICCFARVTDISDRSAELMRRANVTTLFIGQESGDQRMLNLMKKGTRIEHVRPAVEALSKHGVDAFFGFIYGFPGETEQSALATRTMATSINDGFAVPPALFYKIDPFSYADFAAVATDESMSSVDHYLGYGQAQTSYSARSASEEVLATLIATGKRPNAPFFYYLLLFAGVSPTTALYVTVAPERREIFRWMKLIERGTGIFLERDLEGKRPSRDELRRIKEGILSFYPARGRSLATVLKSRLGATLMGRLHREWANEGAAGPGLLTRLALGLQATRDTGEPRHGLECLQTATYPAAGTVDRPVVEVTKVAELADNLVSTARLRSRSPRRAAKLAGRA